MQRTWWTRLTQDLGPRRLIAPAYVDELGLPPLEQDFGEAALLALSNQEEARFGHDAWAGYTSLMDLFLPQVAVDRSWGKLTARAPKAGQDQSGQDRKIEEFERLVPRLKNQHQINVKPASPADFLPIPTEAIAQSPYVRTYGNLHVYYYDLPSTVISKVARGAERDLSDVRALVQTGIVSWEQIEARWQQVRASPRGWLRHDPDAVERRLQALRARLP